MFRNQVHICNAGVNNYFVAASFTALTEIAKTIVERTCEAVKGNCQFCYLTEKAAKSVFNVSPCTPRTGSYIKMVQL